MHTRGNVTGAEESARPGSMNAMAKRTGTGPSDTEYSSCRLRMRGKSPEYLAQKPIFRPTGWNPHVMHKSSDELNACTFPKWTIYRKLELNDSFQSRLIHATFHPLVRTMNREASTMNT